MNVINKIIQRGFPPGSEIVENASDVAPDERFWIIPGNTGPRWLLPYHSKYGAQIFQSWKPYGALSQVKWKILYGVYLSGHLGIIPGISSIGIAGFMGKSWSHFGWEENSNPIPIIYIGTVGATQKAVLSLVDSSTQNVISVAKVPLGSRSSISILHEYDELRCLEVERVKVAPKPIFVDRSQGIAVQEVIKGEQSGYKFTHKHEAYLMKLKARDGRRTNIRIEAQKLVKRVSRVKNTNQSLVRNINEFVDMLEENFDLPIVHGHGDFKPWNIIQDKSGSIVAVDWEFSEANQIAGMDIIHYFYEENILKNKKKYLEMIACLKSYLHMLGVDQVAPLLLKRLLAYYVLWHAVVLCENGYDVTDHTLLLGDFNI